MGTTENELLTQGTCSCIFEPAGVQGLEGYQLGSKYKYHRMSRDKHGNPYYRVFPSADWPDYYETCNSITFARHFEPVKVLP